MERFISVTGVAAALPAANVDTDVIMPKVFLKGIDRSGLARGVFHDLRFDLKGRERAEFVLNREPWRSACFLVVGPNFGCGSSREHAVWGLLQYGVRALIGTSFAGIFFDNCANNGLLAITLPADQVASLMTRAADPARAELTVDLEALTIAADRGALVHRFSIDQRRRDSLMKGLDAIGLTLEDREAIAAFEAGHFAAHPWLDPGRTCAENPR